MSELPDHDRVRDMLKRLEEIQRESVELRQRIEQVKARSPEFPDRRTRSRLFDGIENASARHHRGSHDGDN
jgi:hypothetical protein